MTRTVLSVCAAALLATACAPLMQAPLVYSSKTQAGVNFTTTSAETPGVEISLGYKSLNTAYVPVAVARACESDDPTKCIGDPYDVKPVRGGNDVTFGVKPTEQALAAAMSSASDANIALTDAEGTLKAKAAAYDTAQTLLVAARANREAKAKTLSDIPPPPTPPADGSPAQPDPNAAARLAAQDDRDDAERVYKGAEEEAAKALIVKNLAQSDRDRAATRLADAQAKVALVQRGLNESGTNLRTDALSVYGRFEGRADTKKTSSEAVVSGVVGNDFSTGVASQYLAEGIARGVALDSSADCVKQGTALLGDVSGDARAAKIDGILALCQSTALSVKR